MKKHLIGLAAVALLAGCSVNNGQSSSSSDILKVDMSVNSPSYKLQDSNEELDWLSQAILDKGKSFLESGISSLATYAFKTACAEMGIDVRDATTKKIDQIQKTLDIMQIQIKQGFDDAAKREQQKEDRTSMNEILDRIGEVKSPILSEMKILETIAQKEEAGVDKATLDAEKERFVNAMPTNLNFYGLSNKVWHSTEMLAQQFTSPNKSLLTQTLMDVYDNTLGANDIWDYQSLAPRMNFIKECAFLINSMALLAKIEAASDISKYPEGDSNIEGIKSSIEAMANAVNTVNEVFQKELIKLQEIKDKHDDPVAPTMSHYKRTYDKDGFLTLSTDYTVSAYLATVGVDDVVWQNTVDDFYDNGTSHCFKTFEANKDFYSTLYNDYSFYIANYQTSTDYNLKYYLRDLGFRIPDGKQDAFDESIGIYRNVGVADIGRGFLRGDDYYAYYSYYDWNGNYATKDFCRVGQTFWRNYDDSEVYSDNLAKKMIAFMNPDSQTLYGNVYWTIAHRDDSSTSDLISHFYRGNSTNDTNVAKYDINK